MKVLVGSPFISLNAAQLSWLRLQVNFLKNTTTEYDHVICTSKAATLPSEFASTTLIYEPPHPPFQSKSEDHLHKLNTLRTYFNDHPGYDYYLFLDSDAFPIKKNWLELLDKKLTKFDSAVPIRFENLEKRLHASIFLVKRYALPRISFAYQQNGTDLLGEGETDVGINGIKRPFVLLRSNKVNVHPLLCGVYYDCFYHHACGSRNCNFRSSPYWDMMEIDPVCLLTELMQDPEGFVSCLAGWSPESYTGGDL